MYTLIYVSDCYKLCTNINWQISNVICIWNFPIDLEPNRILFVFQINRQMVHKFWFRFEITRFGKSFSVCPLGRNYSQRHIQLRSLEILVNLRFSATIFRHWKWTIIMCQNNAVEMCQFTSITMTIGWRSFDWKNYNTQYFLFLFY